MSVAGWFCLGTWNVIHPRVHSAAARAHRDVETAQAALRAAEHSYAAQRETAEEATSLEAKRALDQARGRLAQYQRELAEIARAQTQLRLMIPEEVQDSA